MTPERYQRIREIYHAALELEAGERAAFLDGACAGDAALRLEVEKLIADHDQAGNLSARPALEVTEGRPGSVQPGRMAGQQIGHYQILSFIGAGGMGEVYIAQDTRLGRRVALKVLPAEFTQDPERARRFEREARAAWALRNPQFDSLRSDPRFEELVRKIGLTP